MFADRFLASNSPSRVDSIVAKRFTGGCTSPFLPFVVFHMAIGTIMIETRIMYLLACAVSGAAMALYLGILDLTFYSRQGMYAPLRSEGAVELAINSLCIVGGLIALAFSWKLERGQS